VNRALRIGAPSGALLVALLALLAALAIGGGAAPLAIADPGPVVRFGLPIAQLLVNVAAAMTLGPIVLTAFGVAPADPRWNRLLDVAAAAAAVWTVAAAASGLLAFVDTTNLPLTDPGFTGQLLLFLTSISLGQSWLGTTLLAAVLTVLCIALRSFGGVALLVVLAVATLVPMAQQGHAASINADHDAAISSLGLHLVSAAVWLGGLVAVVLAARGQTGAGLSRLVGRYSSIALACFVVVTVSGTVNAWIRLGSPAALLTPYGALVIVKVLALVALGAVGAVHRLVLIPRMTTRGSRPFLLLVAGELVLMGIAYGFAAALGRTPTPVPTTAPSAGSTPAEILAGQPLPPPASVLNYVTQWRFDLIWVLLCCFLLVLYLAGVVRLRRRGDAWPLHRTLLWTLGVLLLLALTNGGLNTYERFVFSAHMMLHMALTMVVPLLLVPAAPMTLALRAIRKRSDGSRGGREWLLAAVHSGFASFLTHPVVAAVLFAVSLLAFYYSPLFRWATTDHIGHEWMTAHFLLTGYLFVQSLIGVDPVRLRFPYPLRLLVLLATMAFHAFFGLSLILGNGLLLADWYGALGWGTDALADQKIGGAIAWSVGELPTVALAIVVALSWSRSDDRESKRLDRAADRGGDADLKAYNDMLARLDRTRA
jgi:cytochrome c oxidase assembly factor CtaG/putative copper export protein